MELIRGDLSSSLGAALGNALLHDIKDLFQPNVDINDILINKSKVNRAKAKVKIISEVHQLEGKYQAICVGVDTKIDDKTFDYKATEDEYGNMILKKVTGPQHHLTLTYEPGNSSGEYLTRKTLPMVGSTGEVMAQHVYDALEEFDSLESIKAILLDNTSVNTGWKNGLVVKLEEKLGRNLHTIGCALHQNELPFRALFKKPDGVTTGPQSFSGPLGKKCKENFHNQPQIAFERVENPLKEGLEKEEYFSDLSTDQRLLYEYTKGIGRGKVDEKYSSWKIGQLHHARWLTLAIRLLALYTREESPSETLIKLVHYIVLVYAPAWFEIKSSSKLHESPRILFQKISRINELLFEDVKTVAKQNLQGNSFCLLPENFVYALVKDEDCTIRSIGLQTIINLRRKNR